MNAILVQKKIRAAIARLRRLIVLALFAGALTACGGGAGGSGEAGAGAEGGGGGLPTVSLSANPMTVSVGGSSQLTWSSTNASSCSASGIWSGSKGTSGSESTGSLTTTGSFTITCSNAAGSVARTVSIAVSSTTLPSVSLTTSKTSVASGGSSSLTWSSSNINSCAASSTPAGAWSGAKPVSGSESTVALTATTVFTLTCTGTAGSASGSVSVNVIPVPPSGGAVGGYPMPSLDDERATYLNWGWTWSPNVEPAAVTEPIVNYYVTLDPYEVRYETEADDLWNYLMMYRRTGNAVYLNRAKAWLRYFKDEYLDDLVAGDNFAHLYGVGLLAWYEHTCEQGSCDLEAFTVAEGIAAEVENYVATYWSAPGSNVAYYGPRKAARFLLFATRIAEVTKNQRWINLRDTLIELWLKEPSWDARGMYFCGDAFTDDNLGKGSWAAGARIQSAFQIGILMESFFRAYNATGRADLRDRMLAMINFVDQYGLDPVYQYTGSTFGFVNGKLWHSYSGTTGIATFWESAYTTSLVNTLAMGYKLTGDSRFLDRAKHFFNRATKAKYGSPTERETADNVVHHFVDTIFSSDKWYLSYNKGELQYTYLIFENGGMP